MDEDEGNPNVNFLYKTMLLTVTSQTSITGLCCKGFLRDLNVTTVERDPRKRRVKPVSHHLLQLDFMGDSSDDSDFNADGHKGSDSESIGDENSDNDDGKSDEEEEEEGEEEEEEEKVEEKDESSCGVTDQGTDVADYTPAYSVPPNKFKVLVCCVCLGDSSNSCLSGEANEIVECDGCQINVHEGCYGITESQSVASTISSASTEPWFCDSCKAGVKPHCELCPNSGGIYKETDTGRWVHLVCALYIPGVAFADVDRLSPVTLFEMAHTKWGSKECSFCEDDRFSATGVCISCDAGMCRNFFHVTCAQREGLLSEASPDEDIADPFYAYCKQHVDKSMMKYKRRNYLAVQSNVRAKREQEKMDVSEDDSAHSDKLRVQRKLNRHRQKYLAAKQTRPSAWVPPEKVARMLHSNPFALKQLTRKAQLMGVNTQAQSSAKDVSKKWHIAPAFTADFVSYFLGLSSKRLLTKLLTQPKRLDRDSRIRRMRKEQKELELQQKTRQKQEKDLRIKYDKLSQELENVKKSTEILRDTGQELYSVLQDLAQKPIPLPEVFLCRNLYSSSSSSAKTKINTPLSPTNSVIHSCGLCAQTNDQHLLAKCDKCRLHYHLGCLDPPLSRMPKKTKQFGWQCSECAKSHSDSESEIVTEELNAPRRLRDVASIREPNKYMPFITDKHRRIKRSKKPVRLKKEACDPVVTISEEAVLTGIAPPLNISPSSIPKKPRRKKKKILTSANDLPKSPPVKRLKVKKELDMRTDCCVCNESGDNGCLVRCDECSLCFHFRCLDPPCKKSPKVRGYGWVCSVCRSSEEDEEEDEPQLSIRSAKTRHSFVDRRNYIDEDVMPELKQEIPPATEATSPRLPPTLSPKRPQVHVID
ncbi:hypothetical protein CAPTEDRAFT_225801 [Capitella teleta]|uniref:PHD finger protein 14 n=1 Tax=Capitella teleta TaxID=283909 RepID=R7UVJ3_CAPTE|nr:hypothetical protein CAPTEDRAFT_225801 [Capitella teleta]|eukprot:ELU07972.1 hypothetical protein CAPTEDRAFT_225801 [Capitella teleta]